jgi:PadR family transcriptional regulator, regulatory protein PadR
MRKPTYLVLAALADGPLPGYGIIKDVEHFSDGQVRLAVGVLYTVLDRLAGEGYVRPVGDEQVAGRVRKRYGLTASGLTALHAEARRAIAAGLVTQFGGDRIGKIVTVGGRVRLGGQARAK